MTLLALRLVDVAIFGTLGTLWIGGATFVFLLWRWVIVRERAELAAVAVEVPEPPAARLRPRTPSRTAEPLTAAHG
jgi:hypothetical protein